MTVVIIATAALYISWTAILSKGKYLGFLAWLLQAVICFYSLFDDNGWKLHIANAILLVSWLSVLVVFLFNLNSRWVKVPIVIFVLAALLLNNPNSTMQGYSQYKVFSWQLDLHISLSMLAYAILSVASLYAISLYVHIVRIKNTTFTADNTGLMSLIDEEKKLFYLIFLGWLILSTSLLSGVVFIENFVDQHLGHKIVFSLLAWLVFGLIIIGRLIKGWRGEKLILLTIIGMTLLATGYLGSKVVLEWVI